ncbi:MAG: YbbR-like domain-containing protein [Pyrinomonadaceae bacterium]
MTLRDLEKDAALMGRRWLRELLFEDWGLKVLALVITFGLWWAVTGQRTPATVRLRHVQMFLVLPGDVEVSNDLREEVDLTLRGSQRELSALKTDDVAVNFDASTLQPGAHLVRLTPQNVMLKLPEGVSVESVKLERIEPSSIKLELERRIEREFVVNVPTTGMPPAGYELIGIQSVPNRVRVRGPESHVNALQKILTEPIALDGRTESFTAPQVVVDITDPKVVPLETAVDVQVQIGEAREEKTLTGVGVQPANGAGLTQPARATVTLRGPRSTITALRAADVKLLLEQTPDGQLKPRLQLPPGLDARIELVSTKPAEFSIKK